MKLTFTFTIFIFLCSANCKKLPKNRLSQASQKVDYNIINDSLKIEINNKIKCPIRIMAKSTDKNIQDYLDKNFPLILTATSDTTFSCWTDKSKEEINLSFSIIMGNPNEEIHKKAVSLPFKRNNRYKINQGYNGSYSHRSEYSKFSLDFSLKEGDTVCAAAQGVIVGVIEHYVHGGNSKKWRNYANFITIYHPDMNLFTQYAHLKHKGTLVNVGDSVQEDQPIGLSGNTGFTNGHHLHFNVLKAIQSGMESLPIDFKEGYKGNELKKGDWVKK